MTDRYNDRNAFRGVPAFNVTPKQFCISQLAGTSGTLYTAPSGSVNGRDQLAILRDLWLCNTDSVDRTYTLYVVESGGGVAVNRMIANAVTLAAGATYHYENLYTIIPKGGTLRGMASAADKITVLASGDEYT